MIHMLEFLIVASFDLEWSAKVL